MKWDTKLNADLLKTWKNICHQVNNAPSLQIPRFIGSRSSSYELVAYVDASQHMYGSAVYIVDVESQKTSFLLAKNRIVSSVLKTKSIAALELLAVELGTIILQNLKEELSGSRTCNPIKITKLRVFTDSSIALDWITAYNRTYAKMNGKSVFVMNRLGNISKQCSKYPIEYSFVSGAENPADCRVFELQSGPFRTKFCLSRVFGRARFCQTTRKILKLLWYQTLI